MDRLNVKTISQDITQTTRWNIAAAYLRLIDFTGTSVDLEFFRGNVSIGIAQGFLPGLAVEGLAFDAFTVTPNGAGTVTLVVGDAPVKYDRAAGTVTISGTPTVNIGTIPEVEIKNDSGNPLPVSVSGNPALAATPWSGSPKVVQDGMQYGASYKSNTAQAANTPDTVFTAAANVNGAVVYGAEFSNLSTTNLSFGAFVAKATAPASNIDGDVIVSASAPAITSGNYMEGGSLANPIFIPAGKGLYYITSVLESYCHRSCLYKLL